MAEQPWREEIKDKGLTIEARTVFEKNMDYFINNAEDIELVLSDSLQAQGIEPNVETVLSHISGFVNGTIWYFYLVNYDRALNSDETIDLLNLVKRRSAELKSAFISSRIYPLESEGEKK